MKELEAKHEGLQTAHRKLLERVMDLELKAKYQSASFTKGPPPGMDCIRPAYRSRRSLLNEAQAVLDAQQVPEKREVDEKGRVNA